MTVLHISNLSLSYKGTPVFTDLSVTLSQGSVVGIVGPNGSGKTTLVRTILGEIQADYGTVGWMKRTRIGYVPQVFPHYIKTPLELAGYDKADILGQFGVGKVLWNTPSGKLSGGERTRLSFAMAMAEEPGILVLDEPTNHLDIPGMEWLEKLLASYKGTVLVISHDRYFLDKICTEIWELRDSKLKTYPGGYTSYLDIAGRELVHLSKEHGKWSRKVRNLKVEARNRRAWFKKAHDDAGQNDFLRRKAKKHARQFQAKERALNKLLSQEPEVPMHDYDVSVNLDHKGYRTKTVIRGDNVYFGYPSPQSRVDGRVILQGISYSVGPGMKIGLIGHNGCGKTTLLRLITGELVPDSGDIWVNPHARIGYISQMMWELRRERDNSAARNMADKTDLTVNEVRDYLGMMGIRGDDQVRPISQLSMGQQTRVALACLTYSSYDCLLLDEPTNHLDIQSRELVERALSRFSGAIVAVTHDRYFLDVVCNTIWRLDKGSLQIHKGNYTAFLEEKEIGPGGRMGEGEKETRKLAVRANLAHVVSKISETKDPLKKADLEKQYDDLIKELKDMDGES